MRYSLVIVCFLSSLARAQEGQGFAEVRVGFFPGAEGKQWQVVERVRPTLKQSLLDRISLVTTVEAGLAQGRDSTEELERVLRESGLGPMIDSGAIPLPRYENSFLRINGADNYLDVDRLYLDVYGEHFDLRVGRQALNWGSGQFFNPTDPFPQVLLAEPWRPRAGVNAVRLNVPFGEANDVSAVLATNDSLRELRAAGRVRFNWSETDFALVGAWRGDSRNVLLGVDLRGTFGVGWWVEAAYLLGKTPHEEVTVGIDYSFPLLERAVVSAQYYRNGAGSTDPASASPLLRAAGGGVMGSGATRDPFAPFTSGRDYGLLGASVTIGPELSASVSMLQNLNDGSGTAIPTVNYAVLDWLQVAASAQVPYALWGRGGEFKPRAEALQLPFVDPGSGQRVAVDLTGLVPAATLTFWTRASF
jgi:hypothetical protein